MSVATSSALTTIYSRRRCRYVCVDVRVEYKEPAEVLERRADIINKATLSLAVVELFIKIM